MKIYNSLTFKKEEFKSIKPNEVLMYVCGPTVYDSPHLGHAKSAVVFDLIHRYLKFKGYKVNIVKNYTDIDDKIIQRANDKGVDYKTLTEEYIKEYDEIMQTLNVEKVTKSPRATEVIDFMIDFIKILIKNGHAYEKNGSVYFSVKKFDKYNSILQNINGEELEDETEDYLGDQDTKFGEDKDDSRDFALWKKMKEGEPFWESPWGKGRPGWHIECSAMALNFLGTTIDIHGGGQDLKFPHHRNEIAQSESYSGKPFAHFFVHNGFVNIDDEKMSKSLGNFFTVTDVLKKYEAMVIRWFLLSSHYRSSINYSFETMDQAQKTYNRTLNTIKTVKDAEISRSSSRKLTSLSNQIEDTRSKVVLAMDDDFDTPVAIAEILSLFRTINKALLQDNINITQAFKDKFFQFIEDMDAIFGIFPNLDSKLNVVPLESGDKKDALIKNLLTLITDVRNELRDKKLYTISDTIRARLRELGIEIEDKKT
jgi:cysteinyl-tRNA synthetase